MLSVKEHRQGLLQTRDVCKWGGGGGAPKEGSPGDRIPESAWKEKDF